MDGVNLGRVRYHRHDILVSPDLLIHPNRTLDTR